MKMFVAFLCVFALLVNVSGCGSKIKGDAEMEELYNLTKQMKDAASKDPAKALEYLGKVAAAAKKLDDLKLTDAEKKALEDKWKSKLEALK
jgi:hypothetical protein